MSADILLIAIGNESRGDDALGPLLLRQLDDWIKATQDPARFELLEDFQLQVEHALDLKNRKFILFMDAGIDTPAPFSFYRVQASEAPVLYSHALSPESLLSVYRQLYQEVPREVYVLCIRGSRFELGEPPTASALERLAMAFEFCKEHLQAQLA